MAVLTARVVGRDAVLVECADLATVRAVYAEIGRRSIGATDVVPAATTVLLDGVEDPEALAAAVAGWDPPDVAADDGPLVEVPVTYDGPDLAEVARRWRVDQAAVADLHTGQEYVVAFCGFAPGFAYCSGLPARLAVPRRAEPRTRVPAGAVGLAGELTGIYPRESPGGWQLIGRTDLELWRADREPPALLQPGTRVRFVRG